MSGAMFHSCHAVVVDAADLGFAEHVLRTIRRDPHPLVYLKPAYLYSEAGVQDDFLLELSDGPAPRFGEGGTFQGPDRERMGAIARKIELFMQRGNIAETVFIKMVRYLASRGKSLEPLMRIRSKSGFTFPFLECQFPDREHLMFETLDWLETAGLLSGSQVDAIHMCGACDCAFLNFRETCPQCSSVKFSSEDLVHHFVCGYVGPESDFKGERGPSCPKCRKGLRHIGVDHDRPSVVRKCRNCDHDFQEPVLEVVCLQCRKISRPENLSPRAIKKYQLTALGEATSLSGLDLAQGTGPAGLIGLIGYESFASLINQENERKKRYKSGQNSTAAFLTIGNKGEMSLEMGRKASRISQELAKIIKWSLRSTDVISYRSEFGFMFLMVETDPTRSDTVLGRIKTEIEQLLQENIQVRPEIAIRCWPIDGTFSLEQTLSELTGP